MSGLEVIGGISAIIAIVDASIKIYNSARKDLKLPEAFETVGRQLPVVLDTLKTCESRLEPIQGSMPADVCAALKRIVESCNQKAVRLKQIFERVMPGKDDDRKRRYQKTFKMWGKGDEVEKLMTAIKEDVKLMVDHYTVKSSTQKEDLSFQGAAGMRLGQAPYIDPKLFVGRQSELDEMAAFLKPDEYSREHRRLVLGGIGGVGKTQLVIAYANHHRDHYQTVFWLDATSQTTVTEGFRSIAQGLFNTPQVGDLDAKESCVRVHRWLSDLKNTRWLLIFDNYDDPKHPAHPSQPDQFDIQNYYPPASHGSVIVTTRRPDLVAGKEIRIESLGEIGDSLEILATRSQREGARTDPHAKLVAERLGGFPLALATAGAYLRTSHFSFERYLQEYEKRWNIDPRRPPQLHEYQDRTLYTTWNLSYTRLESEDPSAAKLLKLFAYFDNQNIWYELLSAGSADELPESLRKVITDDVEFSSTMRTLTDYCFVEMQKPSGSWSIHNCVHDYISAVLNKDVDPQGYSYAFSCVGSSANVSDWYSLAHLTYTPLVAHAMRLVCDRYWQDVRLNDIVSATLDETFHIGSLFESQRQYSMAEQMRLRSVKVYEKTLGREHLNTLEAACNLGHVYARQDRLEEAEQLYLQARDGREKALGPEHVSTLNAVYDLGLTYKRQGRLEEAMQLYLQARDGYEKALGPEHTSTLNAVHNLGVIYYLQDRLEEAEQLYLQARDGREKALGPEHASTLNAVYDIGLIYERQDRLKEAEQLHLRVRDGYEKALGPEHTSTLNAVHSLAVIYERQDRLEEAEQLYLQARDGYEKALGPEHMSTLDTVRSLGLIYRVQGQLDQAIELFSKTLSACRVDDTKGHSQGVTADLVAALFEKIRAAGGDLQLARCYLAQSIQHVDSWGKESPAAKFQLARAFLVVKDDESAVIAFIHYLRCKKGMPLDYRGAHCDDCQRDFTAITGWYMCRQCPDTDLCEDCMSSHTTKGTTLPTCHGHDYFNMDASLLTALEAPTTSTKVCMYDIDIWFCQLKEKYPVQNN